MEEDEEEFISQITLHEEQVLMVATIFSTHTDHVHSLIYLHTHLHYQHYTQLYVKEIHSIKNIQV